MGEGSMASRDMNTTCTKKQQGHEHNLHKQTSSIYCSRDMNITYTQSSSIYYSRDMNTTETHKHLLCTAAGTWTQTQTYFILLQQGDEHYLHSAHTNIFYTLQQGHEHNLHQQGSSIHCSRDMNTTYTNKHLLCTAAGTWTQPTHTIIFYMYVYYNRDINITSQTIIFFLLHQGHEHNLHKQTSSMELEYVLKKLLNL